MGTVRDFEYKDKHNNNIIKDKRLDFVGVKFMVSEDKIYMTFNDYYNYNFDHEFVYNSWKYQR